VISQLGDWKGFWPHTKDLRQSPLLNEAATC